MILIEISCNFFSRSPSRKNSKIKRAYPRAMGDRLESLCPRKDLCWSVRAVYVLEKQPDVSGLGLEEAGRYTARVLRAELAWCERA
jgi:hypothetical protein